MVALIEQIRDEGDSVGGVIECVVRGIPAGLGEPVFDKLEADLAKAMMSLPATKGFEIGSGFAATRMRGSEHNDPFEMRGGKIRTTTNNSGGVQRWQAVFISFGVILVLFEMVRGWRLGLLRQLVRVAALAAAYAAAFYGGRLVVPLARPFLKMPDIVLSILGGAALALVIYA